MAIEGRGMPSINGRATALVAWRVTGSRRMSDTAEERAEDDRLRFFMLARIMCQGGLKMHSPRRVTCTPRG
jgi:hypothetical protein